MEEAMRKTKRRKPSTKLDQRVLDGLCRAAAHHCPYGIGDLFYSMKIAKLYPELPNVSVGRIDEALAKLYEDGFIYVDTHYMFGADNFDHADCGPSLEGWLAWSEWKDEFLLGTGEGFQDWCHSLEDIGLHPALLERLLSEEECPNDVLKAREAIEKKGHVIPD
jgi:hypothetical protein